MGRFGRHAAFLRFWTGDTFTQFGAQIGALVIPVVAVTILHATEFQVGVLNAVETLAFLLLGLPAGAWIDRMIKRRVMLAVDAGRAILLALIPVLWAVGALEFWQLVVIGTLVGVGTVFFDVSYQSFISKLVPSTRIADANGRLETTAQVARIAGPALGGGLLAVLAAPILLIATTGTYLLSLLALLTIRDNEVRLPRGDRHRLVSDIREGMAWVLRQPLLVRITASVAVGNLFGTIALTMLPVLILRTLGISPTFYGIVFAIGGLGGVLGGVLAAPLGRLLGEGRIIPISSVTLAIGLFVTAAAALLPAASIVLLIAGDAIYGFAVLVYNVTAVSYRQRICPPELLGRMNASVRFPIWGVIPLGGIVFGLLATWIDITPTLFIGAARSLLASGFVVLSPLRTMQTLPTDARTAPASANPSDDHPVASA